MTKMTKMTKRTFEGKVGYAHGIPTVFIDGRDWYFPDFDFKNHLKNMVGQTVRVSIEVEPITLKDRIEKIFEKWESACMHGTWAYPTTTFDQLKAWVLAAIQEEELDKHE